MTRITEHHIRKLLNEGEHQTLEMKKCRTSEPESVWETVSAFANTRGGVILPGVFEHNNKPLPERFEITGVEDANKVVIDFFNLMNNPQKINRSVLVDSDVRIVPVNGKDVIYINVPEADYRQKPIFINQKLEQGTYKRGHEGDRRVNRDELALLLRDSSDDVDSQIIEQMSPRARKMSPRTRKMSPRAQKMSPRAQKMSPRAQKMSPRAQEEEIFCWR